MSAQRTAVMGAESQSSDLRHAFNAATFDFGLTSKQEAAINLLAIGYTSSDVSSVLSISRSTVNFWNKHLPQFKAQLEVLQEQLAEDKTGVKVWPSRRG